MMLRNNRIYRSLFWSILLLFSMETQSLAVSESNKVTTAPTLLLTSPAGAPTPTEANPRSAPVPSQSKGSYSHPAVETQNNNRQLGVAMNTTATTQNTLWPTVGTEEKTSPKISRLTSSQVPFPTSGVGIFPALETVLTTASHPPVGPARSSTEQTTSTQTAPSHLHAVHSQQTGPTATLPPFLQNTNVTSTAVHFTPSTVAPSTVNSESASASQTSPIDVTSFTGERTTNTTAASDTSPSNPTKGPPSRTGTLTTSQSSSAFTTLNSTVDSELNATSSILPEASSTTEFYTTTSPFSTTGLLSSPTRPSTTARPSTTDESSPTTELISVTSTISSTANSTNSSLGILIPRIPKKLPIPTTDSPTFKPSAPKDATCSKNHRGGLVGQCLIAIASLAGVATIFMVCTIVLCTKLSSRKHLYHVRRQELGTEMVCISTLMSKENSSYGRLRPLKSNGALLPQMVDDSDEEGGDNLTLNSFLPENDHSV